MNQKDVKARLEQAVAALTDEIVKFGRDIVRIETENPPGNNYRACAELVGDKLRAFGYQVEYVAVPPGRLPELAPHGQGLERVSVVGRLPGKEARPVLHFTGHMDVVPAGDGWTVPPYEGIVKDGKLYGRGACDQKSGIVAQVFVAEAIRRAGFRLLGTVESSATPDEETGGYAGVGYLVEKGYIAADKTDYVVITECLDADRVCIGHRGAAWMSIATKGKKSHGSMPDLGINALDKMIKLLHLVNEELKPRLRQRTTDLPVAPAACRKSTLAVTVINAGTKVNTVPDRCTAEIDRRLIPGETVEGAIEEIRELCRRLQAEDPDFQYEINRIMYADPTLVPTDTPLVKAFLASGEAVVGHVPEFVISPGTDDQRFVVQHAGIEQCIVYGPGALNLAHQTDEYVAIADILTAVKVMAHAAMELLGYEDVKRGDA